MKLKKTKGTATYESEKTAEQIYDLVATSRINANHEVTSIEGGSVRKEQKEVASFSRYSEGNLNVNFSNVTPEEQMDILASINEFVADIEAKENNVTTL